MPKCADCKWLKYNDITKKGECMVVKGTEYSPMGIIAAKVIRKPEEKEACPDFAPKD